MTGYGVRRIREDDWPRLRDLRLEALRDTPLAYRERYDDAVSWPEENWRKRAHRGAVGDHGATFVAVDGGGAWVGMLGVYAEGNGVVHVVSVYVSPAHRGAGVAERLLDSGLTWARESAGARTALLFVHEHNPRARRFYLRAGFTETGMTIPYEHDVTTHELEMARALEP